MKTIKRSKLTDCLETTAWGMRHFGSIVTNRQLPLAVMRQCIAAGLCKCIGMVVLCDGDGFTVQPERYRQGYVLTKKGQKVLDEFLAQRPERKNRWTDAPQYQRCQKRITLRDGSKAQCGRSRAKTTHGSGYLQFCWQHDARNTKSPGAEHE